jgi:hypothetical protein
LAVVTARQMASLADLVAQWLSNLVPVGMDLDAHALWPNSSSGIR